MGTVHVGSLPGMPVSVEAYNMSACALHAGLLGLTHRFTA